MPAILRVLLCCILFSSAALASAEPLRVLFIGNSYTFYNDMPRMLRDMSVRAGQSRPLEVRDVTIGGASLQRHWDGKDAHRALADGHWDYVVIQDFSTMPVDNPEMTRKYARLFAAEARKVGAKPIFYLTWAREYAPEMQPQLDAVYTGLARETGGLLAPVGEAWKAALADTPKPDLYIADGSHPTFAGSYLTASVFYALLYGSQPPAPSADQAGQLLGDDAGRLQLDAWDSLQAMDVALRSPSLTQAAR